ncbi:MAG: hypothetical protein GEU96_01820 [Propionibacteriales bacterium]|nr:hypothetical protein [Propionibacteriales bacterium]
MTGRLSGEARLALLAWATTLACALAFAPLLQGFGYVMAALVITAMPVGVGIALRSSRLPPWAVLTGQVVALVVWLTAVYGDGAILGLIPTRESAESIRLLLEAGLESARSEPPPAPATGGLLVLVVLGIAGCHLLVDLFAATLHRVPLTGLPLLALYTVPAAVAPDGVPTMAFVVGAAGFVLLLASDERSRLGHWGRQLVSDGIRSEQAQRRITSSTFNAAAQRVGVISIVAAAAVPLLLPQFPDGLFGQGTGTGPGGGGRVNVSNPMIDLKRDLTEQSTRPAMTVTTDGPPPQYFRMVALDKFDGRRWSASARRLGTQFSVDQPLVPPPGLDDEVDRRTQDFEVHLASGFRTDWLPAPYAPSEVDVGSDWRYNPETMDIVVGDEDLDTEGLSYSVTSVLAQPNARDLLESTGAPARITNAYTDLPDDLPPEVEDLTDQITGTGTRYDKAVRLQMWFREGGDFEYTLDAPTGHSDDDLVAFLIEDRRGYCEQFSAAMAVMARHAGIPARVAVGFLRAESAGGGRFTYTQAALHAWPELYFEGAGWVRFEPTPGARDGAVAPSYSTGDIGADDPDATAGPSASASPTTSPTLPEREADPGAAAASDSGGQWGRGLLLAGGVILVLAAIPGLSRVGLRRRRWARAGDARELAEAAWAELRDTVIDLRHSWPDDTPRRTAAALQPILAHD